MIGDRVTGKRFSGRILLVLFAGGLVGLAGLYIWQASAVGNAISNYLLTIQSVQRGLHLSLGDALRTMQTDGFGASLMFVALSFFYGVFHAAGPGHGKVVITTYLISHESKLLRGVILSFSAAMFQGLTAIIIVTSAVWLLDLSMRQTRSMANDVEVASFALITLVGLLIIGTRLWRLFKPSTSNHLGHHDHPHNPTHRHDASCGHSHGPTIRDLDAALSLRTFIAIVLSIGIRPCSGAVIVLLLAYSLGIGIAGLCAVLAMSLGTALTITLLAGFSVYLRKAAQRLLIALPDGSRASARIMDVIGLLGGGVIFSFGLLLLSAAVMAPTHPFK